MTPRRLRRDRNAPEFFLVRVAIVTAALCAVLAAQAGRPGSPGSNDNWVATWATAPIGRVPPPATAAAPASPTPPATPTAAAPAAPAATPATNLPATATAPPAGRGGGGRGGGGGGGRGVLFPNNQTLRQIVRTSLGGDRLRLVLANTFGTAPLEIGAAHVSLKGSTPSSISSNGRAVTFSGERSTTIPPGATVISDPIALSMPNFADLVIDLHLPSNTSTNTSTTHRAAIQTSYLSNEGNFAGSQEFPVAATSTSWYYLARVEVTAPERTPVIVALGDSITDGTASTVDTNNRWPNHLARRLATEKGGRRIAVINAGISGNRVLSDSTPDFGQNILARFDRDVLTHPGATHVVFMLGINDIGGARTNPSPSAADLIAGHRQVIARARAKGLKIFGATLTPYEGAAYFTPNGEEKRQAVNTWIRTSKEYDGVIDFDAATRDPNAPTKFLPAYDSGDHLHPSDAGYEAMAKSIDLGLFR